MGGVTINTETCVLDSNHNVLPGAFAAGEVVGGIHGGNRIGGNAVADIIIFGTLAGHQAAMRSKKNVRLLFSLPDKRCAVRHSPRRRGTCRGYL